MNLTLLKNNITNNLTIKVCSFLFGYCLWIFLSQSQMTDITLAVPLYFYGSDEHKIMDAPDKLNVTLRAKRADLYLLDTQSLAVHINADSIPLETKEMCIKNKHLFLPETVSMIDCNPRTIAIKTSKREPEKL